MNGKNIKHLNINPCKMCMPMGASLAFKGIEKSMILIHGSQGCSTYIRRHIAAHYNEPVDIASSSLTEEGTVYGGAKHLKKGLENMIKLYEPSVIGVLTTCLAETIGEDIQRIIKEFETEKGLSSVNIVSVPTPGYHASQYEGYFYALRRIAETMVVESKPHQKINLIVSDVTCEDLRELQRIFELFEQEVIIFPDISDSLDAPFTPDYVKLSEYGTKVSDIEQMSGSIATIELGRFIKEEYSPGAYLEETFNVPLYRLPLPIGLEYTELLVQTIANITKKAIPETLVKEKGRMLDAMIDSHKANAEGRVAIFGSPELIGAVSSLCIENGIVPGIIMTGTNNETLKTVILEKAGKFGIRPTVLVDSDFKVLQSMVKEEGINLLIGNSDGKFIKEKEGIPLVRIGFPIHDHMGAQRRLNVGYRGSLRLLDNITNTLLDLKHDTYRERMYDTYFTPLLDKQTS